jgi:hypothetical protein
MYTTFGTYYSFFYDCLLSWLDWNNSTMTTKCCMHTVVPPDDGHRYARKCRG